VEHNCRVTTKTGRLLDVFSPIREDFLTSIDEVVLNRRIDEKK